MSGVGLITGTAFFPIRPVWSVGSADSGCAGAVADFIFTGAGLVFNATRLISVCGLAAVLCTQPFVVHRSSVACGGVRQQPIKDAIRAPTSSILMHFTPLPQNAARLKNRTLLRRSWERYWATK